MREKGKDKSIEVRRIFLWSLGASTFVGYEEGLQSFISLVEIANFDHVELKFEWPILDIENFTGKDVKKINDLLGTTDIGLLVHAPYLEINLASFNEPIRKISVNVVKKCIRIASLLGSHVVTIHAGKIHEVYSKRFYERTFNLAQNSISSCLRTAEDYGVGIGIENEKKGATYYLFPTSYELLEFVESFHAFENVGIVYDIGHANTVGADLVTFFEMTQERIISIHLHDNNGITDSHMTFGKGNIDFELLIKNILRKFRAPVTLQIYDKNGLLASKKMIEKWRRTYF